MLRDLIHCKNLMSRQQSSSTSLLNAFFCFLSFKGVGAVPALVNYYLEAEEAMESTRVTPPPKVGTLARAFHKIRRLRRSATSSATGADVALGEDGYSIHKLKLSQSFSDYSSVLSEGGTDFCKVEYEKQLQQKLSSRDKETMESLLANLFASISAIKAAYAQLQMAQSPYDPDSIQSSDLAIVAELKRVSELKHSYFWNQSFLPYPAPLPQPALAAQIEEQRNLIKTYKITTNKLEADLKLKDSDILSLEAELIESQRSNQSLESKLHPGLSLCALDDLQLSSLSAANFLAFLRFTFKAVTSFVKLMVTEMESAGWDVDAAAAAIQPDVLLLRKKPAVRTVAFQSYVCQKMFSGFHHQHYDLAALGDRSTWGRRQFFDEFTELNRLGSNRKLSQQHPGIAKFLRAKYQALVHPKMESSFFGSLGRGAAVQDSAFFAGFAEMARRVWLLHCLFFSFEDRSVFQVRRGSRFSEVYMESVVEEEEEEEVAAARFRPATVGFTVAPGFRVGGTLIPCEVCLASAASAVDRRS
ncbi:hypothetical protein BHM03_00038294 [Ensete ventricosum]|nr:hypothetical protein BHM03_00038294 [Ensete ventricosum]